MSLLMEALRRADEEQQRAQPADGPEEPEALPPEVESPPPLEDEPDSLLALDLPEPLSAALEPEPAPGPTFEPLDEAERDQAQGATPLVEDDPAPTGKTNPPVPEPENAQTEPVAKEPIPREAPGPDSLSAVEPEPASAPESDQSHQLADLVLQARRRPRGRRLVLHLVLALGLLLLLGMVGWYYLMLLDAENAAPLVAPAASVSPAPAPEQPDRSKVPLPETAQVSPSEPRPTTDAVHIAGTEPPSKAGSAAAPFDASAVASKNPSVPQPADATQGTAVSHSASSGKSEKPLPGFSNPGTRKHGFRKSPPNRRLSASRNGQAPHGLQDARNSSELPSGSEPLVPRHRSASPATAHEAYRQAMAADEGEHAPIRIRKRRADRKARTLVQQAWQAYRKGEIPSARRLYAAVLRQHPLDRDALLGMAAVALMDGDRVQAQSWYLRLLERDPQDPLAVAGLVSLKGGGEPSEAVARLRQLIAAHPDEAPLYFVLGNLYAAQSRWSYAQRAYFRAHAIDPEHPDYLYNLAVGLDHLGKVRQAADFYRQALAAAQRRSAAFDKDAVRRRLITLTGEGRP